MRKVKLIIIISLFILIGGTYFRLQWYDYVMRLSEDDLVWLEAYERGDTIFFGGRLSDFEDTLIIDDNEIEDYSLPFSPYPFSWGGGYNGNGLTTMILKQEGRSYERNHFFIKKYNEEIPCFVSWNIVGLRSEDNKADTACDIYNKYRDGLRISLKDTTIDGISFDDCLIANMNNSRRIEYCYDSSDTLHVTEFIWSKRYGLLQYRMESETYTRTDIENLKSKHRGKTEKNTNWWQSQTAKDLKRFVRNHLES